MKGNLLCVPYPAFVRLGTPSCYKSLSNDWESHFSVRPFVLKNRMEDVKRRARLASANVVERLGTPLVRETAAQSGNFNMVHRWMLHQTRRKHSRSVVGKHGAPVAWIGCPSRRAVSPVCPTPEISLRSTVHGNQIYGQLRVASAFVHTTHGHKFHG